MSEERRDNRRPGEEARRPRSSRWGSAGGEGRDDRRSSSGRSDGFGGASDGAGERGPFRGRDAGRSPRGDFGRGGDRLDRSDADRGYGGPQRSGSDRGGRLRDGDDGRREERRGSGDGRSRDSRGRSGAPGDERRFDDGRGSRDGAPRGGNREYRGERDRGSRNGFGSGDGRETGRRSFGAEGRENRRDDRGARGSYGDREDHRRFSEDRRERGGYGGNRGNERGQRGRFEDRRDDRGGRGATYSEDQNAVRGPRSWDVQRPGDDRPRRNPEPYLPEEITGQELDRSVRQQLRTLSKENADGVAKHLVAAAELLDVDAERALDHAQHAVSRAGRVPAAREALGLVYYRLGAFSDALREFRTARRLSGSDHLLPYMVDCERGLGRFERALELANSPEAQRLSEADNIELAIVVSGVRRDMGQARAAVVGLRVPALNKATSQPWAARLFYAYADALLDLDEPEEAREWFVKALSADTAGETDAAERIDELDGIEMTDLTPEDENVPDPRLAEFDLSRPFGAAPASGETAAETGGGASDSGEGVSR